MVQESDLKSICFNLPDSYSLFFPGSGKIFGGAEVRGVTIAKEMAIRGHQVAVVIKEFEKHIDKNIENVRVVSHAYFSVFKETLLDKLSGSISYLYNYKKGVSKDDYLKWRPYIKVNTDHYAAFEITTATKHLVNFCKAYNKKFVLFIASDGELSFNDEPARQMNVKEELATFIIGSATKVFVQNDYQLEKLKFYFNISGTKINNPLPLGIDHDTLKPVLNGRKYIIWIGKSSNAKQPFFFKELALQFPEQDFFMVMNKSDEGIYHEIVNSLPPNITFKESLEFSDVNHLMQEARLFVNTSLYEGFPNTFLQAANYGVPILSLNVNPNLFLSVSGGGVCCQGDPVRMKETLTWLLENENEYSKMAVNLYDYVVKEHSVNSVVNLILKEL